MIKNSIMYHNVAFVEPEARGDRLFRYPKEILPEVNEGCRAMARYACNCEIRFVTDAPAVQAVISSMYGNGNIIVYYGDYCVGYHHIKAGETLTIPIARPDIMKGTLDNSFFSNNAFSKDVIRIHMHGFWCVFGGIDSNDYDVRPPRPDELPSKTILAYGSSITHGSGAYSTNLSYMQVAARMLKCDLVNKGVGGSCQAELCVANWLIDGLHWDAAMLEVGINMQSSFEYDEFEKRYTYIIKKASETGKHIFAPSMYRCFGEYVLDKDKTDRYNRFNYIIRDVHSKMDYPNLHFIDGEQIVSDTEYLSADGIHPCTEGHALMGAKMAEIMKKFI